MQRWWHATRIVASALAAISFSYCASRPLTAQTPPGTDGWSVDVSAPDRKPASRKAARPPARDAQAGGITVTGDARRTRVAIELTTTSTVSAFRLTKPWRVVADMPDTGLARPVEAPIPANGLVTGLRAGLFAEGKLRVVIDTTGPVAIETSRIVPASGTEPPRLEIVLTPTSTAELRATEIASAVQSFEIKPEEPAPAARPVKPARPTIVIDAGHGGIDPGAQGATTTEKDIVLSVAKEVSRQLGSAGRYDVVLTRSSDVFVSLDQRVEISNKHHADLFVSIHADSLDSKAYAQSVRGATVYTLAEKATDAGTAARAAKENASDLLAGLDIAKVEADTHVRDILFDLMRRESANFSADFRKLLVGEMKRRLTLAREPYRSGPFRVLRQPGSPAVLIELGFLSNAEDERSMTSQAWQRSVAEAVAKAVDSYFKKRAAGAN